MGKLSRSGASAAFRAALWILLAGALWHKKEKAKPATEPVAADATGETKT